MLILFIVFALISMGVSWRFRSKIKQYSEVALHRSLSGAEIAEQMLSDHGITNVRVISAEGQLTDHYNPAERTVNLSHDVYHGRSVSSAAIAAHECGHAVQHATQYSMLQFRSAMVPVQNASARVFNVVIMAMFFAGYFLFKIFPMDLILYVIIGCQAMITVFALVTLPVEFDASNRALAWLTTKGYVLPQERAMAKDALNWAASTYVVAALSAIASLLYWVMMLTGRRD